MRNVSHFAGVLLLLTASSHAVAKEWYVEVSYDEALKKAEAEKKLVFIDFYAVWCGPCKMMDASTFKDPKVIEWLGKHTVPIKIDAEKEFKLSASRGVVSYPTLLFLKPDGTEIDRLLGYVTPDQFLEAGAGILEGKDAIARAKEKLDKGDSTDPSLRMQLGSAYAMKGRYPEALAEYLWCLDEGFQKHPEMGGARIFVIMEIMMLAQGHPKALVELEQRRDRVRAKVFEGEPTANDIFNFATLNEAFREPHLTQQAYDQLRTSTKLSAEAKNALVRIVMPYLLQAKRYADIAADIDVMAAVDEEFAAAATLPSTDEQFKIMLIHTISGYYQVLVGLGRQADAEAVASRLLKFADRVETYNALAWAGYLTGKPTKENVEQARKANKLANGESSAVTDTLARVLRARGHKAEAVKVAREGLKKAVGEQERIMLRQCLNDVER